MSECLAVWVLGSGDDVGEVLRCHLKEGHQDSHWDKHAQVLWFPWSAEQEAARERLSSRTGREMRRP